MSGLSEKTIRVLSDSGWSSNHSRDISDFVELLEGRGFPVFPAAKRVLEMFAGIEFSYPLNDFVESFHFNPHRALGDAYEYEDFEEFEDRIGESLVVIGEACRGNMIMFISESGKLFGKTGYYLEKIGDDIYEALDTLCIPRPGQEIK